MSFKERAEFSLVPGPVRRHEEHVIRPKSKKGIPALKAAVIYGANASGKSNLIKAMKHAQNLVNEGVKSGRKLPYSPFKLDSATKGKPSRFEFEIKVGECDYAYGFTADETQIHEEWLFLVDKNKDALIFERASEGSEARFDFSGIKLKSERDQQFLDFTAKGTPANRLFINECKERNVLKGLSHVEGIKDISNWFEHSLNIIFPNSKYTGLEMEMRREKKSNDVFSKILNSFDTGVEKLSLQEIEIDKDLSDVPEQVKKDVLEEVDNNTNILLAGPRNTRYQFCKDDAGEVKAFKLMTAHIDSDGREVLFDINEESDGTQRLIDIAPGLVDIFSLEKTYIIDELDRSLHPDITTSIFKAFLTSTSKVRSQLIVTTHETNLLNQNLIRKDEVWFVQKSKSGESLVYSLEEFQPRFDKDVRRGYLAGRFGGVPALPKFDSLLWMKTDA